MQYKDPVTVIKEAVKWHGTDTCDRCYRRVTRALEQLTAVYARARDVVGWDWSENDPEPAADVERLRHALYPSRLR